MKYYNPDQREAFYRTRFEQSGGRCEICGEEARLVIDHDHVTGKMRGLLCYRHNMGMGMFQDSPIVLEKAAKYLREAGTTGENWVPKRKRPHQDRIYVSKTHKNKHVLKQIALDLLQQPNFGSDRARAKKLAEDTGISYGAAQSRIVRLRKEQVADALM